MLKEFLASLHPSLAVLDGVPMWVFAIVVVLTAVVLLGYLLKGGQVGWQLWMSVRRIRALTKKGSGPGSSHSNDMHFLKNFRKVVNFQ